MEHWTMSWSIRSAMMALFLVSMLGLVTEASAQASTPGEAAGKAGRALPGGEVMAFREGMTRPERLSGPDPVYTAEALKARVQGLMIVKCIIATDGYVHNCRIIKPLPFMEKTVLDALAARRYKPVTFQGRPVNCDYVFNIKMVIPSTGSKSQVAGEPVSATGRTPVPPADDVEYTKDLDKICHVHEITGKSAELGLNEVAQWLLENIRTRAARRRLAELPQAEIPVWLGELRRDAAARGISPCPFSDAWEEILQRRSK